MTTKEMLKTIITDNQFRKFPKIWTRTMKIPVHTGKIITLAGVRRSGKTFHLYAVMKQLIKQGVIPTHILYLNFEDERLKLTTDELDLILQSYRELYPNHIMTTCYFFFDEIQEVPGWEKFIARLYHSVSPHIFVTGSNAKLLSGEIATALRGRTITYEIYPLSFQEFIEITASGLNPYSSADKAKLVNLFDRFLYQGGFPEVINKDDQLQNKILQEYFSVMVLRDLIERYKIPQATMIKYYCKRVIGNSAGEFSVNKIYNELKSQGYKIGKDTVYEYQGYVDAIYLARFIPKYAHSVVKSELSQKKCYVVDQGMGVALDFKFAQDKGRLLETTVALELLKQGKQIAYTQNGNECDFVVVEKGRVAAAIQVALDLSDTVTKKREIKGLIHACQTFGLQTGTIITLNQDDEQTIDDIVVRTIPAWKYFLQR